MGCEITVAKEGESMSDQKSKKEEPALACEVCLKEIDHEEAETFEVDEYVHHFCGLDCYSRWQKKPGGAAKEDRSAD